MRVDVDPMATDLKRHFFVVWQDPETRELVHVADLEVRDADAQRTYEFRYTAGAASHPRFRPFHAFPDLEQTYRNDELFAFFQNRVMSSRRPDYPAYLSALGLTHEGADPVELLARTGGERTTDTIQIVPAPRVDAGREVVHFLASGTRHVDPDGSRTAGLESGAALTIRPESDNASDPRALLLDVRTGEAVGYIPSYLLDYVHKRLDQSATVDVIVEQVNGPPAPSHLRLLCRMDVTRPGLSAA
jgi:hypothetical protein